MSVMYIYIYIYMYIYLTDTTKEEMPCFGTFVVSRLNSWSYLTSVCLFTQLYEEP